MKSDGRRNTSDIDVSRAGTSEVYDCRLHSDWGCVKGPGKGNCTGSGVTSCSKRFWLVTRMKGTEAPSWGLSGSLIQFFFIVDYLVEVLFIRAVGCRVPYMYQAYIHIKVKARFLLTQLGIPNYVNGSLPF